MNESFGVNVKDLTLTQINAYLLELVKARKAENDAIQNAGHKKTDLNKMPIRDLKDLGVNFKKVIRKNGRR